MSPMREEESAPEYTPTPKLDQNKDYEECKKKVEEEMTGAVKKYTIPKLKEPKETKEEEPKDQRSPRDPRTRSPITERGYEKGNTVGILDRDSRSPERRHDWKKSSERGSSRDSSQDSRDSG